MLVIKMGELMKLSDFQDLTLYRLRGTQGEVNILFFWSRYFFVCAGVICLRSNMWV